MYISRLGLRDFRSWAHADVDLSPGRTVFLGPNGHGKTNLVEAAWYLCTLGSHRVATDLPLIRVGAERAVVSASVVQDGRECAVDVEIASGRANRARLNRSPVRSVRDVVGVLQAVLFAPEDLALVRGDPADRRRYLDDLAIFRRPGLAAVRADYDKVLRQRTALLKTAAAGRYNKSGADPRVLDTLEVWDSRLAAHGAEVMAARIALIQQLAPEVEKAYRQVAGGSSSVTMRYRASIELGEDEEIAREALHAGLLAGLAARRAAELERGICLVGPHRDDIELRLADQPAKVFASHGESWSFALALRLAAYELLRMDGGCPVLLLDDVFAELDGARRAALASAAASAEQILVTAAVPADVPAEWEAVRVNIGLRDDEAGRISVLQP